jgi:hypothetical protein
MIKFEKCKMYIGRNSHTANDLCLMNIESRTARYAMVNDLTNGIKRCHIKVIDGVEVIIYDEITVYRADRAG